VQINLDVFRASLAPPRNQKGLFAPATRTLNIGGFWGLAQPATTMDVRDALHEMDQENNFILLCHATSTEHFTIES
jgi:hypothetical protein